MHHLMIDIQITMMMSQNGGRRNTGHGRLDNACDVDQGNRIHRIVGEVMKDRLLRTHSARGKTSRLASGLAIIRTLSSRDTISHEDRVDFATGTGQTSHGSAATKDFIICVSCDDQNWT